MGFISRAAAEFVARMVCEAKDGRSAGYAPACARQRPKQCRDTRQVSGGAQGHDAAVAEIVLDGSGVLAVIGQLVAAAMSQHVAVGEERETGSLARATMRW